MLSVLAIIVPLIVLVIMIWKKVNIAVSAIVCTAFPKVKASERQTI